MRYVLLASTFLAAASGCVGTHGTNSSVVGNVEDRMHVQFGAAEAVDRCIADAIEQKSPITEEDAIHWALWRNAAFREALVELELTQADLVQAGLLPNPEVVYFFAVPGKPFKYAVDLPIEAIWLRPIRVKVAEAENARAGLRLTQLALDLIRDVRQAHADTVLAGERFRVARSAVELRKSIEKLAIARVEAGDASALESATAKLDTLQAEQDAARIFEERTLAEERLKTLVGITPFTGQLMVTATTRTDAPPAELERLTQEALISRPDLLAAENAAEAASERIRLARVSWIRFLGILDATSGQRTGHDFGPAARMTLPIFNRNQGGIARAEAEWHQLSLRTQTLRDQITQDVRSAHARLRQASAERAILTVQTKPEAKKALKAAVSAYDLGEASYLLVLETNRRLIDADFREAQLNADTVRAWAELERACGKRLTEIHP